MGARCKENVANFSTTYRGQIFAVHFKRMRLFYYKNNTLNTERNFNANRLGNISRTLQPLWATWIIKTAICRLWHGFACLSVPD